MRNSALILVPALVGIAASALLMVGPVWAQEARVSPEGGNFVFPGGSLSAVAVKTKSFTTLIIGGGFFADLQQASMSFTVPPGKTVLANVTFSTDCSIIRMAGADTLRVRVLDNGTPLEPYDGFQDFCAFPGTYTGNWAKRVSAGTHTIKVQQNLSDLPPKGSAAVLKNWSLKVTLYQ